MKHALAIMSCLTLSSLAGATASKASEQNWDLVGAFEASTHVFFGELEKILPEPNYQVGATGVLINEIEGDSLPMKPLVWLEARELSFSVDDSFKQPTAETFIAFLADPDPGVWSYVETRTGDELLVRPPLPNQLLKRLQPGDRGLFFVRLYAGSEVHVLHAARMGTQSRSDLALLKSMRSTPGTPLAAIVAQSRARETERARREAAEFKAFEDDYYKILRIQDLDIRTSLLKDLIARMGFNGLWSYYEYKERYLEKHGRHTDDDAVPSGPTEGNEKLWHDISGELRKIEVIQKAREAVKKP